MTYSRSLPLCIVIATAMAALPAVGPAAADTDADRMAQLTGEIAATLDRAERERLADPWLIRDLRALLAKYVDAWPRSILHDDFSGRGPQPDPPWQVTAGEFLIDWRAGLRSVVQPKSAATQQPSTQQKQSSKDTAKQLLGELLTQAIGSQNQQKGSTQSTAASTASSGFAAIVAPIAISNAFELSIELTARSGQGGAAGSFEIGPYQGNDAASGYRLVYTPAPTAGAPVLELRRYARNATSTVEFFDQPLPVQAGQPLTLGWTRDGNGAMVVSLNGEPLMEATDRSLRGNFNGFAMVNFGGDYAVRQIAIDGVD
jgi:hypothetical protein